MENDTNQPHIGFARTLARNTLKKTSINKPPILLKVVILSLSKDTSIKVLPWKFTEKISGMLARVGDETAIGYNLNQHIHRQRFTVAHEVGHLLLGHVNCTNQSSDPNEIDANQFAGELLMPIQFLKKDYRYGTDVKKMAQIYFVSEEAMWHKLLDNKLI